MVKNPNYQREVGLSSSCNATQSQPFVVIIVIVIIIVVTTVVVVVVYWQKCGQRNRDTTRIAHHIVIIIIIIVVVVVVVTMVVVAGICRYLHVTSYPFVRACSAIILVSKKWKTLKKGSSHSLIESEQSSAIQKHSRLQSPLHHRAGKRRTTLVHFSLTEMLLVT